MTTRSPKDSLPIMMIKHVLVSGVLAVLGCTAASLPYLVLLACLVAAQHSFNAVYPATVYALVTAALGAQVICLYTWRRNPRSLTRVLPFMSGALIFFIVVTVQTIPGR
jgi:hypothetical protein